MIKELRHPLMNQIFDFYERIKIYHHRLHDIKLQLTDTDQNVISRFIPRRLNQLRNVYQKNRLRQITISIIGSLRVIRFTWDAPDICPVSNRASDHGKHDWIVKDISSGKYYIFSGIAIWQAWKYNFYHSTDNPARFSPEKFISFFGIKNTDYKIKHNTDFAWLFQRGPIKTVTDSDIISKESTDSYEAVMYKPHGKLNNFLVVFPKKKISTMEVDIMNTKILSAYLNNCKSGQGWAFMNSYARKC